MSQTKLLEHHFSTEKIINNNQHKDQINRLNEQNKTQLPQTNEDLFSGHCQDLEETGKSKITNSGVASALSDQEDTDVMTITLLHNRWKQNITEKYTSLMEEFSYRAAEDNVECLDDEWLPLIKYSNTQEAEGDKQYAFSIVLMINGTKEIFQNVYPEFHNKKKNPGALNNEQGQSKFISKPTLHSEEILIQQLDDFLQQKGTTVQRILIYTFNSPCLKRENETVPCMFQLLYKVHEWYKHYGVNTNVAFTKSWGLSGPNSFRNLTCSTISCPSTNVFYPCLEKRKDIPFKLDPKRSRFDISEIYNTLSHSKDKEKLQKEIQSAKKSLLSLAENSCALRQDHLDRGFQMIRSFIFVPEVHGRVCTILEKQWKKMVDDSSVTPIRKYITEQLNSAVVHRFRDELNSSLRSGSPLRLQQVHKMQLSDELISEI